MLSDLSLPRLGSLIGLVALIDVPSPGGCGSCGGDEPHPLPPDVAPATASVTAQLYADAQQTCPVDGTSVALGSPTPLVDNQNGAEVTCQVLSGAAGSQVTGTLIADGTTFSFNAPLGSGTTGSISLALPGSGTFTAASGACTFAPRPGTLETATAILDFSCSPLVKEGDPAQACGARQGVITLENCEQ